VQDEYQFVFILKVCYYLFMRLYNFGNDFDLVARLFLGEDAFFGDFQKLPVTKHSAVKTTEYFEGLARIYEPNPRLSCPVLSISLKFKQFNSKPINLFTVSFSLDDKNLYVSTIEVHSELMGKDKNISPQRDIKELLLDLNSNFPERVEICKCGHNKETLIALYFMREVLRGNICNLTGCKKLYNNLVRDLPSPDYKHNVSNIFNVVQEVDARLCLQLEKCVLGGILQPVRKR